MAINWKHIESLCKASPLLFAEVDGQRLLSNGHFAFAFAGEFPFSPETGKDYPKLADLWIKNKLLPIKPEVVGRVRTKRGRYLVHIGARVVRADFVRCFGESVTWTAPKGEGHPYLVHQHSELVALVMPTTDEFEGEESLTEPTDEDIFGANASVDNGWYLLSDARLNDLLLDADHELYEARKKLSEAEEEVKERERELDSLEELLASRRRKG